MFANQTGEAVGTFPDKKLKAIAESSGLEMTAFNSCFDSNRYANAVTADAAAGRQAGVNGTPTIFVNGTRVQDFSSFAEISSLIDAALAR